MGKRTRSKRKRRKTRRGGVSENSRNVVHQIYTQVTGQGEENGFYGRLYTLIEDDHLNELAQENPLLDHQLQMMADALRHFKDTVDAAQGERVHALREDLNTQLENMENMASGIENELSEEMVREIRAEIVFLRDTFDQITH
jgi:hypothetical protein